MINQMMFRWHRPERGWDPVPAPYARIYAEKQYQSSETGPTVADVLSFTGDLRDKEVLDLGAGPGHYAAAFAALGARVTWHDISRNYLEQFRARYRDIPVEARIGYLEEATGEYDLVFNRICSYYAMDDRRFAWHVVRLLKPGGHAYLVIPNEGHVQRARRTGWKDRLRYLQFLLNDRVGLKIGHPFVSSRTIRRVFADLPSSELSFTTRDDVVVVKLRKRA